MPTEVPETVKKYAGFLSKGLIIQLAPEIAKGVLVEFLKGKKISVKSASTWVQNNTTLWDILEPEEQDGLKELAERVGNIDWLTADWVIDAIKKDLPAIASLFLGWKKANNWLKKQVEIIRKEVEE